MIYFFYLTESTFRDLHLLYYECVDKATDEAIEAIAVSVDHAAARQERFRAMTHLYYRDAAGAVLWQQIFERRFLKGVPKGM